MKTWEIWGEGCTRVCVYVCVYSLPFPLLSEWFHLGNKLSSPICRCLQTVFCPEKDSLLWFIWSKSPRMSKWSIYCCERIDLSVETGIVSHPKIRAIPWNSMSRQLPPKNIWGPPQVPTSHQAAPHVSWPPLSSWNPCPQHQSDVSKIQITHLT